MLRSISSVDDGYLEAVTKDSNVVQVVNDTLNEQFRVRYTIEDEEILLVQAA